MCVKKVETRTGESWAVTHKSHEVMWAGGGVTAKSLEKTSPRSDGKRLAGEFAIVLIWFGPLRPVLGRGFGDGSERQPLEEALEENEATCPKGGKEGGRQRKAKPQSHWLLLFWEVWEKTEHKKCWDEMNKDVLSRCSVIKKWNHSCASQIHNLSPASPASSSMSPQI